METSTRCFVALAWRRHLPGGELTARCASIHERFGGSGSSFGVCCCLPNCFIEGGELAKFWLRNGFAAVFSMLREIRRGEMTRLRVALAGLFQARKSDFGGLSRVIVCDSGKNLQPMAAERPFRKPQNLERRGANCSTKVAPVRRSARNPQRFSTNDRLANLAVWMRRRRERLKGPGGFARALWTAAPALSVCLASAISREPVRAG